jgi:hypothetical protein
MQVSLGSEFEHQRGTHKFSATDISEDGDIDRERYAEGESDVEKLANVRCRILAGRQIVGASCVERNLSAGESQ